MSPETQRSAIAVVSNDALLGGRLHREDLHAAAPELPALAATARGLAHLRVRHGGDGASGTRVVARRMVDGWHRWRGYTTRPHS